MSGPTNRRFVRSAWALLAFQFVAAGGALALAVWAATKVQALIDQRDLLQARVTQLEAHPAPVTPAPDEPPATENMTIPVNEPIPVPTPIAREQAPPVPPTRNGGSGVTIHTGPPPVVTQPPQPPRQPPEVYVPPREPPPVRYPPREPPTRYPPREPPVTYAPPREPPPVRYPPREPPTRYPPREPPVTYVPPRQPPVRPNFPTRPTPTPQQPVPGTVRPTRPPNIIVTRPVRPTATQPPVTRPSTNAQPIDPRRIRRPRPTNTDPQPEPPK